MSARGSRRRWIWVGGIAIIAVPIAIAVGHKADSTPARATQSPPVPVSVVTAAQHEVPIFLSALGTVQAWNTISVHAQIDGALQSVNFTQGQEVHQGDILAQIDPRTLKAVLDQAVAKKASDQAQLVDDQKDLQRFKQLAAKQFETQQNVDLQQAKVDTARATVQADEAAIEGAQTQLSYATITSPIDGRTGFRQVDAGNIIHANDPNPLTVVTQIKPVQVTFTLPQDQLGAVREAMLGGQQIPVLAFDQDNQHQLAQGELMLINNQIDSSTSTISLKASFPNNDERLWPGEFLRIRVQVATRHNAVTIPPVAIQRGPDGLCTWVVKRDRTVEQRNIETEPVDNDSAIVTKGVAPGETVVVNGQYRLEAGTRVSATSELAANDTSKTP